MKHNKIYIKGIAISTSLIVTIAIIAIILSAISLSVHFTIPTTGVQPKVQKFKIQLGEGKIIEEVNEEEKITGEFHRWEPPVIVVKKGDTVELTVVNDNSHAHSFVLPDFNVNTGRIPGKLEQPDEAKRTVTVRFVADKAGIFIFFCGIPFNPAKNDCAPDHSYIVGYPVVLET
jgi:heme/copper-type cytochrome/quinol oxidase subunit 2